MKNILRKNQDFRPRWVQAISKIVSPIVGLGYFAAAIIWYLGISLYDGVMVTYYKRRKKKDEDNIPGH